jgi:hypothetical protein
MHLTLTELARLESMFAAGEVRSDPPTLETTDRLMDAMILAAKTKAAARPACRPVARAAPARESPVRSEAEIGRDWNAPRSLEDLIEIRRALLRDPQPKL